MRKIFVFLMVAFMVVFNIALCFAENIPEGNEPVVTKDAIAEDGDTVDDPKADAQADSSVKTDTKKETKTQVSTKGIKKAPKAAEIVVGSATSAAEINALIATKTEPTALIIKGTINLEAPITIPEGKDITIKGDATMTGIVKHKNGNPYAYMFKVKKGGNLTLGTNLTVDAYYAWSNNNDDSGYVQSEGSLTIDGCVMQNGHGNSTCGGVYVTGQNAKLQMTSGTITDTYTKAKYYGALTLQDGAKGTIDGGTIQNTTIATSYTGAVVVKNATLTMNGGKIVNNRNGDGSKTNLGGSQNSAGGVLVIGRIENATEATADNSAFTMNGGIISGNNSTYGGGVYVKGGCYFAKDTYSKAMFTMNSGTIKENGALGAGATGSGCGGGVYVEYGGEFTMNAGQISGNKARGNGGGVGTYDTFVSFAKGKVPYESKRGTDAAGRDMADWPTFYPAKFTMNGGTISDNTAYCLDAISYDFGQGGGVYAAANKTEIKGGIIKDNSVDRQGGGLYCACIPYSIYIYDAVIKDNNAKLIGGSIWSCPSGDVKAYVNSGAAVYDNEAKETAADIAIVKGAEIHNLYVSPTMLGGGRANWYQDGEVVEGPTGLGIGSPTTPRFDVNNTIPVTVDENSDGAYAMIAKPGEGSKKLAESKAKVFITGNSANRGGAIGSNGNIITGKDTEKTISATVIKKWDSERTNDKTIPDKVKVWLVIDGYKTDSAELSKDNNWTHTFSELPNDAKVTFKEEKVEGFTTTYGEMKQDEVTGNWEGTITNTEKPDTPRTPNDEPQKPGNKTAKTGDNIGMALWAILAALGLAGATGAFVLKKREEDN